MRCVLVQRMLAAAHATPCRSCRRFLAVSTTPAVGGRRQTARKEAHTAPNADPSHRSVAASGANPQARAGPERSDAALRKWCSAAAMRCWCMLRCDSGASGKTASPRTCPLRMLNPSVPVCCAAASFCPPHACPPSSLAAGDCPGASGTRHIVCPRCGYKGGAESAPDLLPAPCPSPVPSQSSACTLHDGCLVCATGAGRRVPVPAASPRAFSSFAGRAHVTALAAAPAVRRAFGVRYASTFKVAPRSTAAAVLCRHQLVRALTWHRASSCWCACWRGSVDCRVLFLLCVCPCLCHALFVDGTDRV